MKEINLNYESTREQTIHQTLSKRQKKQIHPEPDSPLLLEEIINSLYAFVSLLDRKGNMIKANRAALMAANLRLEDMVNKPFAEAYWWSYSDESMEKVRQAIKQAQMGAMVRYDARVRLRDDRYILIDFAIVPIFDEKGKVKYLVPSGVDVTNRKLIEKKHEDTIALLDSLLNNAPVGFCLYDEKLAYQLINKKLADMNGFSPQHHIGKNIKEIIPSLYSQVKKIVNQVYKTKKPVLNFELKGTTANDPRTIKYWRESFYPVLSKK